MPSTVSPLARGRLFRQPTDGGRSHPGLTVDIWCVREIKSASDEFSALRSRSPDVAWSLPTSVSLDESAAVSFTASSFADSFKTEVCPTARSSRCCELKAVDVTPRATLVRRACRGRVESPQGQELRRQNPIVIPSPVRPTGCPNPCTGRAERLAILRWCGRRDTGSAVPASRQSKQFRIDHLAELVQSEGS